MRRPEINSERNGIYIYIYTETVVPSSRIKWERESRTAKCNPHFEPSTGSILLEFFKLLLKVTSPTLALGEYLHSSSLSPPSLLLTIKDIVLSYMVAIYCFFLDTHCSRLKRRWKDVYHWILCSAYFYTKRRLCVLKKYTIS